MPPEQTERQTFPDPKKEPQLTLAPPSSPAFDYGTNEVAHEVPFEASRNNGSQNGDSINSNIDNQGNNDDGRHAHPHNSENEAHDDVDLDPSINFGGTPHVDDAELAPGLDIRVNRIVAETRSNTRGNMQAEAAQVAQVAQVTRNDRDRDRDQEQGLPQELDQIGNDVILATVITNEMDMDDNTAVDGGTYDESPRRERDSVVYQEKNQCWKYFWAALVCLLPIAVMVGVAVLLSVVLGEPEKSVYHTPTYETPIPSLPAPTSMPNTTTITGSPQPAIATMVSLSPSRVTSPAPTSMPTITKTPQPTIVPTVSLSPAQGELLVQRLADELEIEDPDALPENSAERMSFEWMANTDPLRNELLISPVNSTTGNRLLLERYAIVVLYFSTNGPSWNNQFNFLSASSICSWNDDLGIFCNDNEEVRRIGLGGNNLNGTIPFQLGELVSLTRINLSYNVLLGSIPPSVGNWTNIESVFIEHNQLTGTIPDSAIAWEKINFFDLSSNDIGGSLSESMSAWTKISSINLSDNSLTGTIPDSISSWTQLQQFFVSVNSLSGSIPDSLASWTGLQNFVVSLNLLGGTIPSSLAVSWADLSTFYVHSTRLDGTVPEEFGSLSFLSFVDLRGTRITGDIDTLFCPNQAGLFLTVSADCGGSYPDIICTCCDCS